MSASIRFENYYLAEKVDQAPTRIYILDEVVKKLGLDH